jgi:PmbA protein
MELERILERTKLVSEEAEVISISGRGTEALFEANRLKLVQTKETKGMALRLIKEGRIGFSASNKPDEGKLVAMALEAAPFGAQAKFQFPGAVSYPRVEVYDPQAEAISEEEIAELGQSLIDELRDHTPELFCEAAVIRNIVSVEILNSRGGKAAYKKSAFVIGVGGVLIRGTDMLFVGDSECSCYPLSDIRAVAESTKRQLEWARDTVPAPTGRLPVVFTPHGVASALIAPLTLAFNGKVVFQGASPLGDKKGKRVLDPKLSIWDDATIEYRPESRFCDDEGVPSQRIPLIQDGVVLSFLYDLQTAGLAGTESTGSASRALGSLPTPATSSLVIGAGEAEFEDMLADIKEGLVIEQLIGASQGNVLGGEFSGNVLLGYKVEKGRIVGRVKDTMISGNVYEVLKEGIVLGRTARWVGSSLLTPPILCPEVAVAAKG